MTDVLNLQIPSPTFGGSTGGWLRAAETEEKYAITWTSKKEQVFEMLRGTIFTTVTLLIGILFVPNLDGYVPNLDGGFTIDSKLLIPNVSNSKDSFTIPNPLIRNAIVCIKYRFMLACCQVRPIHLQLEGFLSWVRSY